MNDVGQGTNQFRGFVQRLGTPETHPFLLRIVPKTSINIVENFHVIAEEPDWLNEHSYMTLRFQILNCVFHRRSKPGSAGHSLALESEGPVVCRKTGGLCDQVCGLTGLGLVGIAFRDRALRNAVCREDDGQPYASLTASFVPSFTQPFRERPDEQRMVMPRFDKVEHEGRTIRTFDRFAIEPD